VVQRRDWKTRVLLLHTARLVSPFNNSTLTFNYGGEGRKMEDKAERTVYERKATTVENIVGISNCENISVNFDENSGNSLYFSTPDSLEPQRKKRCIRFASDFSNDDPLLVSDSGFSELPCVNSTEENGVAGVSSFFSLVGSACPDLFEDTSVEACDSARASSSIDTLSLATDLSDLPDPDEEVLVVPDSSSSSSAAAVRRSDSSSSAGSSTMNSSTASEQDSESENTTVSDQILEQIFNSDQIAGHPGRLELMRRFLSHLRGDPDNVQLQRLLNMLLGEFSAPRHRLRHLSTIHDVTRLLRCSKKILVLTGAGISVSCGIPDFRSKDGLYARVSKVFPQLRDPQSVFDIRLFRRDPRPFFLTAKELYPGQFEPSLSHKFIRKLEARGQLLRNYSQNIDTLEKIAGIDKVTMCHGSFATATCIRCRTTVRSEEIKEKVLAGDIPFCPYCSSEAETSSLEFPLTSPATSPSAGPSEKPVFEDEEEDYYPPQNTLPLPPILKPDIVFFGEDLPDEFHQNLDQDKPECDLLLVIGSSLRVRPVSLIPGMLPAHVPQILINRESLPHCTFDIELLGNCDNIIADLCHSLGNDFTELATSPKLKEIEKIPRTPGSADEEETVEEPKSEHDIQALKACWEPKLNENIASRLPEGTYLKYKQRQYVYEGAEVDCDPDEEDDSDSDSSSDSDDSDSSGISSENVDGSQSNMSAMNSSESSSDFSKTETTTAAAHPYSSSVSHTEENEKKA